MSILYFGKTFSKVQEYVKTYFWADLWPGKWSENGRALLIQREDPLMTTNVIALYNIHLSDRPTLSLVFKDADKFNLIDDFIFATKKISSVSIYLMMFCSLKKI